MNFEINRIFKFDLDQIKDEYFMIEYEYLLALL